MRESANCNDRQVYDISADSRPPRAVYIHVPFCIHRCGYCDFTLVSGRDDLIPAYLDALDRELDTLHQQFEVDSVFIGGGTPTYLNPAQLEQLLQLITERFRLAPDGEFSVEANPDGLAADRFQVLQEFGVNRLSLGVQSFDDDILGTLERQHSRQQAVECIQLAADWFDSVAVDLIFGVPGQSGDQWNRTLATAAELPLNHVSTYGLTYEKGTQFYARLKRGQLSAMDNELERQMYAVAIEHLSAAGYDHYEISNYARAGHECRHNLTYWNADTYFGFGPGAARYINGIRSTNSRNVARWIDSWLNNRPLLESRERLTNEEAAREAVMLGLRKQAGISLPEFERKFGLSLDSLAAEAVRHHLTSGNLVVDGKSLRLTPGGRFIADSVMVDFL